MATAALLETQRLALVPKRQRFYRPELDCLRFFAFLGVFVFHTFPPESGYYAARHIPGGVLLASISRAGSFGVDLFFLLSAYLITELLLREKVEHGQVHLRSFYVRRILRIWPLYFLGIGIAVGLSYADQTQKFSLTYVAAFLLLSGNWLTSLVGFPGSVMNPLWSVSFEEQFYLLWPNVVARVRRARSLIAISSFFIFIAALARLTLLKYGRHSEAIVTTNTLSRLDPLALGIIIAVVARQRFNFAMHYLHRAALLVLGGVLWLIAGHFFALTPSFMLIGYPSIALGACCIFASALGFPKTPACLRYLGKISYGLYVFHLLALYASEKMMGGATRTPEKFATWWILGFVLTLAMAALSYQFLESPFLRMKERFAFVKSRPV